MGKKRGGSIAKGMEPRTLKVAVAPSDKPLIETYRSLLDNPETRGAAIEALELVQSVRR